MPEEKKTKILLTTGIFPPDIGGPATYVFTLCEELPKRGFEVKVVTYGDSENFSIFNFKFSNKFEIRNSKFEIYRVGRRRNIIIRYAKYFLIVLKLLKWADIVYTQDAVNAGLPTSLACRLRRKKFMLKIVGDYAWEQGRQRFGVRDNLDEFQDKKYGWRVEIFRRIQKSVARRADKVVTPSRYLKNIAGKWGIDEGKIEVIYNAVKETDALGRAKGELKRELGLEGDIVLSAGRLVPWKGFGTLIGLMPELLKINPEFRLVIIGEGPERMNYGLRITDYGLQGRVKLLGAVEQEVLWQYMRAADMFVLNTGYEGLPHITIEAMQLGLPVVTTRAGGNTEVVEDEKTGLLVDYDNEEQLKAAILRLWRDRALAERLAKAAQESVRERFGKERMIGKLDELLNSKF